MEDQNCIPEIEPESRSIILDGTYRAVDSPNIDGQLQKNRQMDDSQLVGTPAVIAGDSDIGGLPGSTVEVKTEVKRKRGRPPRGQGKPPPPPAKKQKEEEDVCFICFDGGSLVLCDRRGCPKAYHPACIKRDEAFFRSKAKWNCGWHICSVCQKASNYMCYTCPYSLCKGCTKDADYVCVRGDKGFCTTCMKTVMLIENKEQGNMEMAQVDFDDKTSWEYLFKIYWIYLKEKLSLTLTELTQAKSPWKESGTIACKRQLTGVQDTANDVKNCISERSSGYLEGNSSTIRKYPELLSIPNEDSLSLEKPSIDMGTSLVGCTKWATEELLDFVAHMKNGDMSVLSKFDVQALLLEYIKRNNLHDPRRKSQILCDLRLKTLFGKPCVGHFEMLKLLEFHFPVKEDPLKDGVIQGEVVVKPIEILADESNNNNLIDKDKKGKSRKKGEERSPQTNLNEYAAIDVNNINLIYLRRNLMENLLEDKEKFHDKVVGSVVRIRIFGGEQKQDLFRLVQVVGTTKVSVPYKISNTTADVKLEILNLDKKEGVSIDAISNQDLSEDECRRLRQSIKCGLVKRFTVGEIQEKAMALQAVRLDDWLETEVLRLNNLCDRASENGRKKELRECVEKLQLLKTPEERQRRLCQIPDIHSDPNMDPNYESEEDAGELDNKKQVEYVNPRCSGYNRTWNNSNPPCEQSRNASASSYPDKEESAARALQKLREGIDVCRSSAYNNGERKIWHYRDPKGKIQGPFCMVQLQKWSTTGYFPPNMRIWKGDRQDDSILLTDALNGQLHNKAMPSLNDNSSGSQEVSGASNSKLYNSDIRTSENVNGKRDGKLTEGRWHSNINESVRGDRWAHSSVWTEPVVSISKEILAASSLKDHDSFKGKHSPLSSSPLSGREYAIHSHLEINHEIKRCNSDPDHENRNSHITTFCKSTGGHVLENHPNGQGFSGKSSEEKWSRSPENFSSINLDLNSTVSVTKSTDSPDQISEAAENKESVSSNVRVHESDIADLPSPMPNTSNDDLKGQAVENKQSMSSKVPIHDLGPSWSSASGLVDGGVGVQLPDITEEWVGYSPNRVKRSVEEWDSSLISVSSSKPPEGLCDPVATATSRSGEFFNFFPPHPVSNISSWHINVNEPIEFSTLAEESVSDLLAEVDAMESQCGLPSPTSVMKCG